MSGGNEKVTRIGARLAAARGVTARDNGGLPEDCPVYALGLSPTHAWFLNTLQQIVSVPAGRLNGPMIKSLFAGHEAFLRQSWSKTNKAGDITGFETDSVAEALLGACKMMGNYDGTQDKVRGRGAHPGRDGDLVFNLGYALWVRGQIERVGARDDGYIYPRGNTLAAPAAKRQDGGPDGPAAAIEDILRAWNWNDPVYPRLLLGWLAMATVSGAVPWRAHVWINAPHGSGKSTLLRFLAAILDDLAYKAADATAASIRSRLGYDTLAFILDETEAKAEDNRIDRLVELARLSSSGDLALRGTADHGSVAFTLRTAMLMASIAHPPLRSQDQSRFAILKMRRAEGGGAPRFKAEELQALGRRLFRRMVDRYQELPGVFDAWCQSLADAGVKHGHDPEQYGMLLACADLVLSETQQTDEERAAWAASVAAVTIESRAEQLFEWQRVLGMITSSMAANFRGGEPMQIGEMIARAARRRCIIDPDTNEETRPNAQQAEEANRRLSSIGLRVVPYRDPGGQMLADPATGDMVGYLAVANSHAALNHTVFRSTHWAARSGTSGGWKAALQEAPGSRTSEPMKLGGVGTRCTLVDLALVLDAEREAE